MHTITVIALVVEFVSSVVMFNQSLGNKLRDRDLNIQSNACVAHDDRYRPLLEKSQAELNPVVLTATLQPYSTVSCSDCCTPSATLHTLSAAGVILCPNHWPEYKEWGFSILISQYNPMIPLTTTTTYTHQSL